MLNQGLVGSEIAEQMQLPPALENAWSTHGYYGSVSHNVKAIYQRYMGWYDGNPAHLWQHPPVEAARRYVDFMGGADTVVEHARESYDAGDLRWVAEVLNHVIFAQPDHAEARALLADTFEQLGFGSENGAWRNSYLSGAMELRTGNFGTPTSAGGSGGLLAALTPEMLFDALAIRVNGPRAWDERLNIDVNLGDSYYRLRLVNGVLTYTSAVQQAAAELVLTMPRSSLLILGSGISDAQTLADAGVEVTGDLDVLGRLFAAFDAPDPTFAIVTPE
jgi:alkyl sulfatase BDS1-like metallo-beta-lactamase superfamily hydrolase